MNTKLKELGGKAKDFFKNMSMKVRILLCAVLVVVIAVIAALYIRSTNQPYSTIFSGLSNEDKTSILTAMESDGTTDYRVDGDSILVRTDQADLVLSRLLMQGYPKSGRLYETYQEKVNTLTTNSERETYMLISRVQRMEGTIRAFDGVLDAVINMELGEDRTYVLEDISTETKASVKVSLRSGYMLTDQQAKGIRTMVSHAWSGMTIDDVAILDDIGNTYTDTSANAGTLIELKRQLEESQSNYLRTQIKHLLDPLYGAENVNVSVTATVDVSERYQESTTYHQPEGSYENGGLIGHEIGTFALTRDGYQLVGGVPGTTPNSDIPTYVEDIAQGVEDEDGVVASYERDNNLDELKEQVKVAPTVTDVAVAVTINESANPEAGVDIEELRHHVAVAANIRGENLADWVSILIAPFPVPEVPAPAAGLIPPEILPFVIIGVAALVLIIVLVVVILSIRRKKKKQQEEEDQRIIQEQLGELGESGMLAELGIVPPMGENGEAPPPTSGADIMDINTEKSMELRKSIRQFVQNNPEVAALMLKTWLRGGDDDNG